MPRIADIHALELLDSRARPTIAVTVTLEDGTAATAGVPSGASTGAGEAIELRDGDPARYRGAGVLAAAANVNGEIADRLRGVPVDDQEAVDTALIALDGTAAKSRLGANAVVGTSLAVACAAARARGLPVWQTLTVTDVTPCLPWPSFNVINGGVHAPNALDFQEFMITPLGAPTIADGVRAGAEVYAALRARIRSQGLSTGLGDEGGFAPEITRPEQALDLLCAAIEDSGYTTGPGGIAIAMDPASSEFYRDGSYHVAGQALTSADMIGWYAELVDRYPIWSIEDGLAEQDEQGWRELTVRLGERVQIVGDDLLVTNPDRIRNAITERLGNAALIKPNQIGTVSETLEAMRLCAGAGWPAMVSHRSGETPDTFIADLAVGAGCGQLKSGAPARGERVAKYNRLLEIAAAAPQLGYGRSIASS